MIIQKEPQSVLIVSSTQKGANFLLSALDKRDFNPIEVVSSAGEGRRRIAEKDYDIVFINSPLSDEFGEDFAYEVGEKTYSGLIMLVKNDAYDQMCYKLESSGVCCLPKPLPMQFLMQSLHLIISTRARLIRIKKQTDTLKDKMFEIKIVNRAKLVLMQKLGMTESDAHRYIEKRAMDSCLKRSDVAMEVIKTYEN